MIPISQAIAIVKEQSTARGTERVRLEDAAGRWLAEDVIADMDLPPFNRAQMDGYAVRAADVIAVPARLKVIGESAAGSSWPHGLRAGEAVRIMTGAAVPEGGDSVQRVEVTRELDANTVELHEAVQVGQNIVPRAREVRAGTRVLNCGEQITEHRVALLAAFGYDNVAVGVRPRVAVLATGSELVNVNVMPDPDGIRDSNSYTLAVCATTAGALVERMALASDDLDQLIETIGAAAQRVDVLVLSGGVSMGRYDHTKSALERLGAHIYFDRVALRPGKPMVFARLGNTLVFGLPGNPVSVAVTFNIFTRMALLLMQGAAQAELRAGTARVLYELKGVKERDSYIPALLSFDDQGTVLATPLKWGGSSDFISYARAEALIFVPAETLLNAGAAAVVFYLPHQT